MPAVDKPLHELRQYRGISPLPDDFDAYWQTALAELEATDPAPVLERTKTIHPRNAEAFDLWFTGVTELWRIDDVEDHLVENAPRTLVADDLPDGDTHTWKLVRFGPDGLAYVPVGAPCNVCTVRDPYAALLRMRADGSGREVVARGIRNTVGFDWSPTTGELWLTDNGRDLIEDTVPPDELNRVPAGATSVPHFGFPWLHGSTVVDPDLGATGPGGYLLPARELDGSMLYSQPNWIIKLRITRWKWSPS